jgi:hypothetical protein
MTKQEALDSAWPRAPRAQQDRTLRRRFPQGVTETHARTNEVSVAADDVGVPGADALADTLIEKLSPRSDPIPHDPTTHHLRLAV